jgi:AcrR family transcriptional regulator
VGHREDLLAGARRCLYEKGYGRTTARDIVAASGTNLASIGYHYGSKDALMNAALFQVVDEWREEVRAALVAPGEPDGGLPERLAWYWSRMLESFAARRDLWAAMVEVLAQVDRVPQLREALADGLRDARMAWAATVSDVDPSVDGPAAQALGTLFQTLVSGVFPHWLVDPRHATTGNDLIEAMRLATRVAADD